MKNHEKRYPNIRAKVVCLEKDDEYDDYDGELELIKSDWRDIKLVTLIQLISLHPIDIWEQVEGEIGLVINSVIPDFDEHYTIRTDQEFIVINQLDLSQIKEIMDVVEDRLLQFSPDNYKELVDEGIKLGDVFDYEPIAILDDYDGVEFLLDFK